MTDLLTVVVAVDNQHLNELLVSLPTWIKFKGFDKYPFLVIYDSSQLHPSDDRFEIFKGLNVEYVGFRNHLDAYTTQREKMLTALTVMPGLWVKTKYYLKIDTDCVATDDQKWFDESWLNKGYVFITNAWASTKPANAIELLDQWGAMRFPVSEFKPLNLPYDPADGKIKHKRIISWLFLCNTEWSAKVAEYFNHDGIYKLPSISDKEYKVSQDTVLWYIATIQKDRYKVFNFKSKGFDHIKIKV
jgi:hypothetical protein